ncbi:MAG: hypothetical protein RL657_2648 [Pseudomonadota bacterium]|jgi:hypothetical protein
MQDNTVTPGLNPRPGSAIGGIGSQRRLARAASKKSFGLNLGQPDHFAITPCLGL